MDSPRISVIIPTKRSARTLGACLESLRGQGAEIIVVDAGSEDGTLGIARSHTGSVFVKPGAPPAARNFGFSKSCGEIIISVDSDMVLGPGLLEEISAKLGPSGAYDALVIPEDGSGKGTIARCKRLEKRCYLGDSGVEAARAFRRGAFEAAGGYDPSLHFGEDWDLHLRLSRRFKVGRTSAYILHDSSGLSLFSLLKKSYVYGRSLRRYRRKNPAHASGWMAGRAGFLLRCASMAPREPLIAPLLVLLKLAEYSAGLAGYAAACLEAG